MLGDLRVCADEHPRSPGLRLSFDTCMDGGRTVSREGVGERNGGQTGWSGLRGFGCRKHAL